MNRENKLFALCDNYEIDLVLRLSLSKSHARKSISTLKFVFRQLNVDPEFVTRKHLVAWIRDQAHSDIGTKTIRNRVSTLRAFYAWLIECEIVHGDPTTGLRLPKAKTGPGCGAYSLLEIKRLLASTKQWETNGDSRRSPWGPLRSTFYQFLIHTCLRLGEAKAQAWRDIDLEKGILVTTQDKSRRNVLIPLSREVVELLLEWKRYSLGERVFQKVPSHHTLRKDLERAGVKPANGGFHAFRKTGITLRANLGVPHRELAKLARHLDPNLTAEIYDRPEVDVLRPAAEILKLTGVEASGSPSELDVTSESCQNDSSSTSHVNGAGGIRTPGRDHVSPAPRLRLVGF